MPINKPGGASSSTDTPKRIGRDRPRVKSKTKGKIQGMTKIKPTNMTITTR
jgi:hypothetical protein